MQNKPAGKYGLREIHQEIDLLDRKIAYCTEHETFASDSERAAALRKLVTKRESLVKVALDAEERGIACDPKYRARTLTKPLPEEGTGA